MPCFSTCRGWLNKCLFFEPQAMSLRRFKIHTSSRSPHPNAAAASSAYGCAEGPKVHAGLVARQKVQGFSPSGGFACDQSRGFARRLIAFIHNTVSLTRKQSGDPWFCTMKQQKVPEAGSFVPFSQPLLVSSPAA